MKVKFKKFHPDARIPKKAYDKDFCYDVYAVSEKEILPNVWRYGFGFGLQIERGQEPILRETKSMFGELSNTYMAVDLTDSPIVLSVDFRPRSSVYKTGMILSNSEGTIDEGFCDEISAIFYHVNKDCPRYQVGDKIGQIKIGMTLPMQFVEVEDFDDTERGLRGYGSSGK